MASLAARAASREPSQATIARRGGSTAAPARGITSAGRPLSMNAASISAVSSTPCAARSAWPTMVRSVQRAWRASSCGSRSSGPLARSTARVVPVPLGCRPGRGQHRLGLGLGVRQMLAQQLGRQMAPAHPGQERLGDQIERGDLRAAGVPPSASAACRRALARRRLVEMDQQILDRHVRLRSVDRFGPRLLLEGFLALGADVGQEDDGEQGGGDQQQAEAQAGG